MHAGGHVFERELQPGEIIKIDTGCLVGYTLGVDFDIQFIGGIRNKLFGGEGFFFATLRGPGKVWIQTLPVSRLASRILNFATGPAAKKAAFRRPGQFVRWGWLLILESRTKDKRLRTKEHDKVIAVEVR